MRSYPVHVVHQAIVLKHEVGSSVLLKKGEGAYVVNLKAPDGSVVKIGISRT